MLEPDLWDSVLGRITGTITERTSSNALLNLLVRRRPTDCPAVH